MTLAKRRFWLDGGYDREAVEGCPYHPFHRWWTFKLGDVLHPDALHSPREANEKLTICRACYVPRCGSTHDRDRCIHPRHHTCPHDYELSGARDPVGGIA